MTAGNLGFHQPVEAGIDIEDLRDEKIISTVAAWKLCDWRAFDI